MPRLGGGQGRIAQPTVFEDRNGNGEQDRNDPGAARRAVQLLDQDGQVVAEALTDGDGRDSLEVEADSWVVRVALGNFDAGGPLEGLAASSPVGVMTADGDQIQLPVVDDNVLTFDFPAAGAS